MNAESRMRSDVATKTRNAIHGFYHRIPTSVLATVLFVLLVAAYMGDYYDRARYNADMCRYRQTHGWPDLKCSDE